jgi:protein-S-isoprenylcysteine O-methyltransferase Ste14
MSRLIAMLYAVVAYLIFFATFLYTIGFVSGLFVPTTIDIGRESPTTEAVVIDLLLLSVFAVQHSVMARAGFKAWWTRFVPKSVERSTYVLFATLALLLLLWQWRPLPMVVWQIANPPVAQAVLALGFFGWLMVLGSTFLINHFELFGLGQALANLTRSHAPEPVFRTPLIYKITRHPLYLGFIIAFWAAPTMTAGHLLFTIMTTGYIFVGIFFEERDLMRMFGEEYRGYRRRVAMLIPFMWK